MAAEVFWGEGEKMGRIEDFLKGSAELLTAWRIDSIEAAK